MQNQETKKEKSNGYLNEAKVLKWAYKQKQLKGNHFKIYMFVVSKSAGYMQTETDSLSVRYMADELSLNKDTIGSSINYLIKNNFIEKIKVNKQSGVGEAKLASRYKLIYGNKENKFPFINIIKKNKSSEPEIEPTEIEPVKDDDYVLEI